MTSMNDKQRNKILTLARQLDGGEHRFLEQVAHLLPVSKHAIRHGLSMSDASMCIDHLEAEIAKKDTAEQTEPEAIAAPTPADGAPQATDIIAMLGRKVTVGFDGKEPGTPQERTGDVAQIEPGSDGPVLVIDAARGRIRLAAHRLTSWAIH